MKSTPKRNGRGPAAGGPGKRVVGHGEARRRAALPKIEPTTEDVFRLDTVIDGVAETKIAYIADGKFVGSLGLCFKGRRSAGIRQLFVHPDYRGQSIGRVLVHMACSIAKAAGCETVGLVVAKNNLPAKAFYKRCQFIAAYQYDEGDTIFTRAL